MALSACSRRAGIILHIFSTSNFVALSPQDQFSAKSFAIHSSYDLIKCLHLFASEELLDVRFNT